jgi:hypothetical protein
MRIARDERLCITRLELFSKTVLAVSWCLLNEARTYFDENP